jgi:hypothetical protein
MLGSVEQLHYTWTPRGVEGINRFQIAAMSDGFKSSLRPVLPTVRKICRYDRPKGNSAANPVSYGWFDHRQERIAFCRIGLPPVRGKVGNFAAHVLVGPPSLLPEWLLASAYGASSWWQGPTPTDFEELAAGRRDFVLPQLDVDELVACRVGSEPSDMAPATALCHALLTLPAGGRLAVTGSDIVFGRALRLIGQTVPEALEGRSLSTWEGVPTFPFRVVGTRTPSGRRQACSVAPPDAVEGAATLERLLFPRPEQDRLRQAARATLHGGSDSRRAQLWTRSQELVDLMTADEPGGAGSEVLGDPAVVAYLATEEHGRARIARAVHEGAFGARDALRAATQQLAGDELVDIYLRVIELYATRDSLGGCAAVAERIADPEAGGALLDVALQRAVADATLAATLDADDTTAVLALAAGAGLGVEAVHPLLAAAAAHVSRCATQEQIPDGYIAQMLACRLNETPDAPALVHILRARPKVLDGYQLEPELRERYLGLLNQLEGESLAAALRPLLPSVIGGADEQRTADYLYKLPSAEAARCLVLASTRHTEFGAALSTVSDDLAAVLLSRSRARGGRGDTGRQSAHELLTRSRSGDHPQALQILGDCDRRPLDALRRCSGLAHLQLRKAIRAEAIDGAIDNLGAASDVQQLWQAISEAEPELRDSGVLRLLLEHALQRRGSMATAILLAWVARELLPAAPKLLGMGKHLRDRAMDTLARDVASAIPLWCLEEVEPYVQVGDRRGRTWWLGLVDHRRSIEPKAPRRRVKTW